MEEVACDHEHPKSGQKRCGRRLEVGDLVLGTHLYDADDGEWKPCARTILEGVPLHHDFQGIVIELVGSSG